jgi:crotonobetainyl-CoA:carnitine CoA-transferase CaiB-like acyl-CoA transferase
VSRRDSETGETIVAFVNEVPSDPHMRSRGLIVEVPPTRTKPKARHVRQPLKIGNFVGGPSTHAPRLGSHTREVLSWAGYSERELEELITLGVSSAAEGDPETDVDRQETT